MKYICLLFLATSLAITSCDKEDNNEEQEDILSFEEISSFKKSSSFENLPISEIIGEWNWECSSGGFSGATILTPETEDYNKTITFDNNSKYQEFIDSVSVLEVNYQIDSVVSEMNGYMIHKIDYSDMKNRQSFLLFEDSDTTRLVFWDSDCTDCIGTHVYFKK